MPETLGTICYLSKKYKHLKRLLAGYVLTCLGIGNSFTYKSELRIQEEIGSSKGYLEKKVKTK